MTDGPERPTDRETAASDTAASTTAASDTAEPEPASRLSSNSSSGGFTRW